MKPTLALALVLAALAGCTSTTKGEGPSGSSGSTSSTSSSSGASGTTSTSSSGGDISNAQCQSTCISKVYDCNPEATDVPAKCQGLCSGGPYSSSQLSCFQNASCFELSNSTANSVDEQCPP